MDRDFYDDILIITGGNLDINFAKIYLNEQSFDYIIAADSGLKYVKELDLTPNYILGDYDSVPKDVLDFFKDKDIKTYPTHKDYTDTHLAIITAIKLAPKNITILGGTGTRLDHTLTTIGNLKALLDLNITGTIIDSHNKIYLLDKGSSHVIEKEAQFGDFVSIIPLEKEICISLKGFYYPLDHVTITQGLSLTQSNEITANKAYISIHSGIAIVIEARD